MTSRRIVDSQIHVWEADRPDRPWPPSPLTGKPGEPQRAVPMGAEEVLAQMDLAGVERAVLVPPSWEGDRNDLALAAAARWPGRFAVMGRLPPDLPLSVLDTWRDQPGMLGVRLILWPNSAWVDQGDGHPFWAAAAGAGIPVMVAPVGHNHVLSQVADRFPSLRIAIDHMGTGLIAPGIDEFAREDEIVALASRPNVAVKLSAVPCHSRRAHRPFDDVEPHVRKLFDAFGPDRCFWGSDLSRLPCPYAELVEFFERDPPWLNGPDLDRVMGGAILDSLGWE